MLITSLEHYLTYRKPLIHVRYYYSLFQQTLVKRALSGRLCAGFQEAGYGGGTCPKAHLLLNK